MGVWNPVSPETVARAELFAAEEKHRELLARYDAEVSRSAGLQNRVWDLERSLDVSGQLVRLRGAEIGVLRDKRSDLEEKRIELEREIEDREADLRTLLEKHAIPVGFWSEMLRSLEDRLVELERDNPMLKERNRRLSRRVADLEGHLTPARPWLVEGYSGPRA